MTTSTSTKASVKSGTESVPAGGADAQSPIPLIETTPNLATPDNSRNCAEPNESDTGKTTPPEPSKLPLTFTVITGINPTRLTKIIGLNAKGDMRKETSAMLSRGQAQQVVVADLNDLKSHLDTLTSAQAVTWGVTKDEVVEVCTQGDTEAQQAGAIARTRENFKFWAAPGVMMLDHDGLPDCELSPLQFRDRLIAAAPALADAPMLWRPSASAGCVGPDGGVLSGLTRHRLYIPVGDATLIPEAGRALEALLWATTGAGWCDIGVAGQRLPRCLVDVSVWQPERLDFAGPSVLVDGVTCAEVEGVIYGDATAQFNLRPLIDSATSSIKKQAQAGLKAARAAVSEKCDIARRNWVAEKAPALAQSHGIKLAQAANVLERAAAHQVLMGDFELTCADGQVVNVAQLLDNPHRWYNARFADPLDPDADRRVAVARLLNGTRPDLFSHRHGGMRYELRRQSARVQLGRGMRVDSTDAVLQVLRDRSELFDFGTNAIAFVADGKATPVSRDWLVDHAGRVAEFYSVKTERDEDGNITSTREIAEDAPAYIANAIIAKHGSRNFRKLTAVTTAPTLRPDGSVFDEPGHDLATGLMYVTTEAYPLAVPTAPTVEQALAALAMLWRPIRLFPFADEVAIGVTLAAMLAACLRPALPTCPATGFDAPAAGTGKTLLAKCIGALATGGDVAVLPPTNEEDECRKRLFAALRGGSKVLLWDNVREPLGNSVIDSFLTSSFFADRVLGVSENVELPNRALFLVSGNNLVLTGDTHRRILLARLDAQIETPFKREFEFDPLAEVCNNRQALVVAALTIVRAYIAAGRPKVAKGRIASFELWDDLVRQPLCWLKERMMESGRNLKDLPVFVDPADSIDRAASENPETSKLAALLNAWIATFGTTPTSPAQAITKASNGCKRKHHPVTWTASATDSPARCAASGLRCSTRRAAPLSAARAVGYVLFLLFIKYISDKHGDSEDFAPPVTIPPGASFKDMVALKGKSDIGDKINTQIIQPLIDANARLARSDFPNFNDPEKLGEGPALVERLSNLIGIFQNPVLDFSQNRAEHDDILGDAYEFLMRHFASESGKSKGQFYTPSEVSRIIAKVIGIAPGNTVASTTAYDPTCGSGSLLLKVAAEAGKYITLEGQEKDVTTAGLARMNMILHDFPTADIRSGNTLAAPKFKVGESLRTYDYVVANPPFSDKSWSTGLTPIDDPFQRFTWGVPPTKQGDYAYLLHIIRSMKSGSGKAACILPHGVLFRGNAEAVIREQLVRSGILKGIIGLPANLFYGTGIPACILVLDKENANARAGIFMVDASKAFIKDGNKNRLREQDIHKIVDTFTRLDSSNPKYARMVPRSEIADPKNDYNLNLPRYIDSTAPEDLQDIDGHLRGGIPTRDLDAPDNSLAAYWQVLPGVRAALFASAGRPGYASLTLPLPEVKPAIFDHAEFTAFNQTATQLFAQWRSAATQQLTAFGKDGHPKALIEATAEALLTTFKPAKLLDAYDIYQHLMDYWAATMQDDAYLITADGWVKGAQSREIVQVTDKNNKLVWPEPHDYLKGKRRFKSDLVPATILVAKYFAAERDNVANLEAELANIEQQLDELTEEHGGEEGILKDVATKAAAETTRTGAIVALWQDLDSEGCAAYTALKATFTPSLASHFSISAGTA